ncbi:membrane-bound zinc-dependent protease HtpX [Citrifermentans bemidjiense Bem]|uniref:Protease HtpX homolog n=1 Tax=Citrifermentans bemidjiense (strain ATCC BAA-1014 / DSM 16622 / JCM 12645 / Bem) TaxID=404380 RepID=B5EBS5_CITBB|nr:zinc metalloprotease HtpX [Citrifermentans bemidjiense]ACH38949.1 membrane-bound zinc-dependent protease HtpX [Citrifermentans bemidjiense Bem]
MQRLKTTFLLALLTVLMVTMGSALGGRTGMVTAFVLALGMNFFSYWFSDKIVLKMYGAQEIEEHDNPMFYNMVRHLAARAGLPMPKVYIIPSDSPNAFATGRNPEHAAVAATEGILRILSPEELEGVMAHELAHVQNRDILVGTIAATFAGAISMIGNMLQWGAMFGAGRGDDEEGGGIGGLVGSLAMAIIAPIAAMLIQMAVSRSREYLADASGAQICGRPLALASALRKLHLASQALPMQEARPATAHMFIVNPLTGGGIASLFSTHPPMEERIARLEQMAR